MELFRTALIVVILVLGFSVQVLVHKSYIPRLGWRDTLLCVAVVWGVWCWAISELLGGLHQLNLAWLAAMWALALACIALMAFRQRRAIGSQIKDLGQAFRRHPFGRIDQVIVLAGLAVAAVLGLIAWVAAPNNWDSQTYHLSRIEHWIQNQSLAFFPTATLRQLYLGPGMEIILLQLRLLTRSDRADNLVQYAAMIGSVVGLSRAAQLLGGSARAQLFAAIAALTIPMGILQATSTQNDYVTGFWLVCFAAYGLALMRDARPVTGLLAGASLGLAILTKPTGYLFAAPFVLWIGLSLFRRRRAAAVKIGGLAAGAVLLINVHQYASNFMLFASLFGAEQNTAYAYTNGLFTPAAIASNVLRNVALHLGVPQFERVNVMTTRALVAAPRY